MCEQADGYGSAFCKSVLGFHEFTGKDSNCAVKGKGKVTPFWKLKSMPRYQSVFRHLGNNWILNPTDMKELKSFTCLIYWHLTVHSIDEGHSLMQVTL